MEMESLNEELEKYYKIVNLIDDMALGNTPIDTDLLEQLTKEAGFKIEDIADANDCCGSNYNEIIEEFKEMYKNGDRI